MYYLVLALLVSQWTLLQAQITSEGCGKTKNCYQIPDNCEPTTSGCRFVSWRPSGEGDSKYIFEMSGDTGGGQRYISMALALISDMKDADMYYCDGQRFGVGTINVRRADPLFLGIGDDVTDQSTSTVNGVGQCTFKRKASVNRLISEGADHDFDIENHWYYLLVAVGDMRGENMTEHDWRYHVRESYNFSSLPGSSAEKVNIGLILAIVCVLASFFSAP